MHAMEWTNESVQPTTSYRAVPRREHVVPPCLSLKLWQGAMIYCRIAVSVVIFVPAPHAGIAGASVGTFGLPA